ncbi:hypothetical protein [Streptomyces sp. NPDC001889]
MCFFCRIHTILFLCRLTLKTLRLLLVAAFLTALATPLLLTGRAVRTTIETASPVPLAAGVLAATVLTVAVLRCRSHRRRRTS